MEAKQKMQEAYNIWVFTWMIWHNTKSGKLDYSALPEKFSIESESGAVAFTVNIPETEREKLALNTVVAATGVCFTAFDSAMDEIFGILNIEITAQQITEFPAARVIVNQIRNAYAHGPIRPKWIVKNKYKKPCSISEIGLTINLDQLNGRDFQMENINGSVGVAKLLNYCLNNVTND